MKEDYAHLPWFLGPKAENAELMEELFLLIFRDYVHWRRNYFPGDRILINRSLQASFREQHGDFAQKVSEMMAEMRRNFPFFNPRYIGHMSSDVTMPSMIGYFAGLLYNPNNVTVEAAPVTADWEIEATSRILEMLGYNPPPPIPPDGEDLNRYYSKAARKTFGWAHVCSGGTAANIEALWVARNVRYFPLSVLEVAKKHGLDVRVKLRDKNAVELRELRPVDVMSLRPNESIYLLARFVDAVRTKFKLENHTSEAVSERAWQLLDSSEYGLGRGTSRAFQEFPPTLFVSGAAHYSIKKAADVLGIGRRNVEIVNMDSKFRLNVDDLRKKLINTARKGRVPLAVIAIAGTTEEGAVDPVARIVDLRDELEKQEGITFWLHTDAAWGGYVRSLFCPEQEDLTRATIRKMSSALRVEDGNSSVSEWHDALRAQLLGRVRKAVESLAEVRRRQLQHAIQKEPLEYWTNLAEMMSHFLRARKTSAPSLRGEASQDRPSTKELSERIEVLVTRISKELEITLPARAENTQEFVTLWNPLFIDACTKNWDVIVGDWSQDVTDRLEHNLSKLEKHFGDLSGAYFPLLREILLDYADYLFDERPTDDLKLTLEDRMEIVHEYVQKQLTLKWDVYERSLKAIWGKDRDVCNAFLAFPQSDSITVDPHKLGYTPYPCGVVAFRNDRVRHFILQKAPYITSVKQNTLVHLPPKHVEESQAEKGKRKVVLESFGPFMLEGSKPGAAASGLWLASESIPLTMRKHGAIIRASLLAARELHEWIVHWDAVMTKNGEEAEYQFFSLIESDPDTNVVVFVAKKKTSRSLEATNLLTRLIYEQFAIQTELGQRQYSYSQRFFLTKTTCKEPEYPFETLRAFFRKAGFEEKLVANQYSTHGLVVLRSVVMSPYLNCATELTAQDLMREFVEELAQAANKAIVMMRSMTP